VPLFAIILTEKVISLSGNDRPLSRRAVILQLYSISI